MTMTNEASRGAGAQSVTIIDCDCKIDWLWLRSPLEGMKYLLK